MADQLERHTAELVSKADFEALSAIGRELAKAGLDKDDDAHAVAWVATIAPGADRNAFAREFSAQAAAWLEDFVPGHAIAPVPVRAAIGRMELRSVWAQKTEDADKKVRAIAIALLAGEATKLGDNDDRSQFSQILDIAIASAPDGDVLEALNKIKDSIRPPTAPEQPDNVHPLVISVSIDVVGSTEAKQRLRDLGSTETRRFRFYREFYQQFLFAEDRFYAELFDPKLGGFGTPLNWRRLFVVKGIGDEIWLTYEVVASEGETAEAVLRMIAAALTLADKRLRCGGVDEDPSPHFDPNAPEPERIDHMELPFKISIDLVEDAIEISNLRLDTFIKNVRQYLSPPQGKPGLPAPQLLDGSHVEALRRLNAGHFELVSGHRIRQAYRTDFIGPDIDRFFRLTKYALPGFVMIGSSLMRRLAVLPEDHTIPNADLIRFAYPPNAGYPQMPIRTSLAVVRREKAIESGEMKGINTPYAVHHLAEEKTLRRMLHDVERNAFLRPTVKEIPIALRCFYGPKTDEPTTATPSEGDIRRLAHELWEHDVHQLDNATHYWLAAERRLRDDS